MRGHNVMMRYVGNPEATAQAFRGGWFHSGDLGLSERDAETGREFFVITGRSKNIAKVGGESVSLEEVERALLALPEVKDAACITRPDRLLGEEIIAAVVFTAPIAQRDLLAALRTRLPTIAMPRQVRNLESIPRSATGKILRPQLALQLDLARDLPSAKL